MKPAPPRHTPPSTAFLSFSTGVVTLALLSLVFRPESSVFELPLTEDGYYLLSVARNLALGNGITVDGEHPTNGFQPLFAFLLAPVYMLAGGDRYVGLRGVLAAHWLMHIATAFLLGGIVKASLRSQGVERAAAGFWLATFLWLASRYVLLTAYNGLETGCLLFLYALTWRLHQLGWVDGGKRIAFGVVLGLLVLARVDAAVFVVTLAALELLRSHAPRRVRVARAMTLTLVPFLVSSPWWLYNLIWFDSLMPSSGTSQAAAFSPARLQPFLRSVLQVWVPYVQVRWLEGWPEMLLQGAIILHVATRFAGGRLAQISNRSALRMGGVITVSTSLLGLYYLCFSGASHSYGRYLAPFMLVAVGLTAIVPARAGRGLNLAVVVSLQVVAVASVLGWQLQLGVSKSPHYNDQLPLIEAHAPPTDAVGAGQSGTIGYFRDRVVNLDGKVNAEAFRYRDNLREYLARRGVAWYCDEPTDVLGPDPGSSGWVLVATRGGFKLYHHIQMR